MEPYKSKEKHTETKVVIRRKWSKTKEKEKGRKESVPFSSGLQEDPGKFFSITDRRWGTTAPIFQSRNIFKKLELSCHTLTVPYVLALYMFFALNFIQTKTYTELML